MLLPALALLLGTGCDQLNPYKIGERSVEKHLRSLLGPSKDYNVRITRSGSDLSGGYISHLKVDGVDVQTKSGFMIRNIDADLYGVRFNKRQKTLQSVERSAFTAWIAEESANAYLSKNDRGIPGLRVEFEPEQVVVRAAPHVLGVTIPVTLQGAATAHEGNLIRFAPDTLAVSRLNLPRQAITFVEQRINPVFDLDDLKLPARLSSVQAQKDELILRGEVKLNHTAF